MKIKFSLFTVLLCILLSNSAWAFDNYGNTIAANKTGHKILFKCSTQAGITVGYHYRQG